MSQAMPVEGPAEGYSWRGGESLDDEQLRSLPRARYDNEAWRRQAACRSEDPDLFFPVGIAVGPIDRAKAVCAGCEVRQACLAFALTTNQEFGVWGGCDEDERRALRRRWRAVSRERRPRPSAS